VTGPIELGPNLLTRFYRGGPRIGAFRGIEAGERTPEDWVGSTTTAWGDAELGRSRLADGTPLADLLAAEPEAFFEPAHLDRFGPEPGLLVKLLDAGERLPVHVHPDDAFAREHLGRPRGKTEAWIILEAEPDAAVWVGFRADDADELEELVETQDVEALLAATVRVPVAAGDTVFVPAGTAHAIGEGILLLELQQPSDMSILLEHAGLAPGDALLGLAPEVALAAVDRGPADLARLRSGRGETLFPAEADSFFRADVVAGQIEPGFSILVVHEGEGTLTPERGEPLPVRRGSTVLVPYGAGACELAGGARAIRCRPPV
jgi:mannose-6-phosphate isomerase